MARDQIQRSDLAGDPPRAPSTMFEISNRKVRLTSFNPRSEANGEGKRLAADLKVAATLEQHALDAFDRDLRLWLFAPGADGTGDLADQVHPAPNVRQPDIKPEYAWVKQYAGYQLHVPHGITGERDLVISDCLFNAIKFAPQDGGMIIVTFRLQFHPTEEQAGKLAGMIDEVRDVSLLAPEGAEEVVGKE